MYSNVMKLADLYSLTVPTEFDSPDLKLALHFYGFKPPPPPLLTQSVPLPTTSPNLMRTA